VSAGRPLEVAIVLYDGMTTLDAVGPMEVLRFLPGVRLSLVAEGLAPVLTDTGVLALTPTATFDDLRHSDVIVVPGGPGTAEALRSPLIEWLRELHPATRWTTSVCSGALLLAAAGLLQGATAATHFAVREHLRAFGARPTTRRVVIDRGRHIVTAAGVSAGIDMALHVVELLTDALTVDAIRLLLEYAPQPPGHGGTLESAPADVIARAVELGRPHGAIPADWS
jgi:transcriptional regulator GlxA family with amidase domain